MGMLGFINQLLRKRRKATPVEGVFYLVKTCYSDVFPGEFLDGEWIIDGFPEIKSGQIIAFRHLPGPDEPGWIVCGN